MANPHWSQYSHRSKFFFMSAIPFVLSMPLGLLTQKYHWCGWLLAFIWIYTIVFEKIFKMPLRCTLALFRTWITGKNKTISNSRDVFEL